MLSPAISSDMSDLNLNAKDFVPSWLKKAPAAAPQTAQAAAAAAPSSAPRPTGGTQAVVSARPSVSAVAAGHGASTPPPQGGSQAPMSRPPPLQQHVVQAAISVAPTIIPWKSPLIAAAPPQAKHMNPNAPSFDPRMFQLPRSSASSSSSKNDTAAHLPRRSQAEILAISMQSSLKVAAAEFVPNAAKGVAFRGVKVSPLALQPAVPTDTEMLLFDQWCFYFLDSSSVPSDGKFDPTLVFRIDSVATFWRVMNNIPEPTQLTRSSTLYLFRDDINPKWEDPKNNAGGMWKLKVEPNKINIVWTIMACRTIGESWDKAHRNSINGIVLKVREKGFWIEVWTTEKIDAFAKDIHSAIEQEVPAMWVDYLKHSDVQELAAAANSTPKSSKKGGSNKGKRK